MSATRPLPVQLEDKMLVGDGCWPWLAARSHEGYGYLRRRGRTQRAHRVVYEWLRGPIPEGLELDHLCRNTSCVNPAHLEPVPHVTNVRRGDTRNSGWKREHQTCARGHAWDATNTRWYRGTRRCRACDREQAAVRRQTHGHLINERRRARYLERSNDG